MIDAFNNETNFNSTGASIMYFSIITNSTENTTYNLGIPEHIKLPS